MPAATAARVAREFARSAELSKGRSMIAMGAGTNHWFHSDEIYRTFLTLIMLCGCQGVNGGGWAHYVGQEKVRPLAGWQQVAFALDWQRPPRHMTGTSFFYTHTGQWRYEKFGPAELASPLGRGLFTGKTFADSLAQASRLGWTPSHPAFNRNPLDLCDEAKRKRVSPESHIVSQLREGRLRFAAEDPDDPANWPRVLTVWRANLLGSSGKGMEYFMRHLLGTHDAVRADESPEDLHPAEVTWREETPRGKLDLLTAIDFRMTSTCTFADVVLPAATWYEKHDISTTDMHPFVHSFNPAIAPPWETRTDFDAFTAIARDFSRLAGKHLGTRTDVVAAPLMHDTPDELAQPGGVVRDWKAGECDPVPGVTMPRLATVERDYPATAAKMAALGPLTSTLGSSVKGVTWIPAKVRATTSPVDYLALILLLVIIVTGIVPTLFVNLLGHGYDYRTTVAEWFRGLFSGSPDVAAIANAPVVYQVHAASAWLIWAVWPFSRLVHAWSAPLWYLWRPYIVYRSRVAARPAEPGTSGRRWRKIGVPY